MNHMGRSEYFLTRAWQRWVSDTIATLDCFDHCQALTFGFELEADDFVINPNYGATWNPPAWVRNSNDEYLY